MQHGSGPGSIPGRRMITPVKHLNLQTYLFLKKMSPITKKIAWKESFKKWLDLTGANNPDKISNIKIWQKFGYCP